MKLLIAGLFAFAAQLVNAETPADFCSEVHGCTPWMRQISQQYAEGNFAMPAAPVASYSGVCVHLNDQYYPETEHHGAFSLEKNDSDIFVGGIFSFYAGINPYQDFSADELNQWLRKNSSSFKKAEISASELFLGYVYPEALIGYWMRHSTDGALLVIGKDAGPNYINLVFCKLNPQAN